MKVLFLPQTCELGPSSRYRVYQLLPHLQAQGIDATVSPGIDEPLYRDLYLGPPQRGARSRAFRAIRRQRQTDLEHLDTFDAVFIQKPFFPGLSSGLEHNFAARKPVFFDFDDAVWLPRQGGSRLLRWLHRESRVQSILRESKMVFAGNGFLADYTRRFNPRVEIVPSVIDTARYQRSPLSKIVGWIGSRTTMPYLKPLREIFQSLSIRPRVIAAGDPSVLGFPVDFRPWQLETEHAELAQIGIGLAPLPDTPWENGKCGVKLLQYMACGIPVIASPVGVHRDIVQHGVNGFLAATPAEWRECLEKLIADESLRARLGAAGLETVRTRYDITVAAHRLASAMLANTQT